MSNGVPDKDPPIFAMAYAGSAFSVLGILLIVLALLIDCLQMLHALLGAFMLISGIFLLATLFRDRARYAATRAH